MASLGFGSTSKAQIFFKVFSKAVLLQLVARNEQIAEEYDPAYADLERDGMLHLIHEGTNLISFTCLASFSGH